MSGRADPEVVDGHLRAMCREIQRGSTIDEAVEWFYCDAPHGPGMEPGYAGKEFYLPKRCRTKRLERHREVIAHRKRGWRYEAIACALHMSASCVGAICRDAGLGKEWYAVEWSHGKKLTK